MSENEEKIRRFVRKVVYLGDFENKKSLADWLKIDPSAISQWKRTGNIPKNHLERMVNIIEQCNQSLNIEPIYVKKLENHITDKEVEIIRAFRGLPARRQEWYYLQIKADELKYESEELKAV